MAPRAINSTSLRARGHHLEETGSKENNAWLPLSKINSESKHRLSFPQVFLTWQIEARERVCICPDNYVRNLIDDSFLSKVLSSMVSTGQRRHHFYTGGSETPRFCMWPTVYKLLSYRLFYLILPTKCQRSMILDLLFRWGQKDEKIVTCPESQSYCFSEAVMTQTELFWFEAQGCCLFPL